MTLGLDSQQLESYVPVYDAIPDKWEDARPFVVQQLKKISNAVNIREIGFYLDQELLSGKSFIPGTNNVLDGGSSQQFRQILRIVVVFPGLTPGANTANLPITNDANFTLIDLWATGTNSTTLTSTIFCNSDTIRIVGNIITVTSNGNYDRAFCVVEYLQEL